jgi:hypothetical protein
MGDNPDVNDILVPGLVPLVSMETGEIEYVVAHTEWDRLDAMWPVKVVDRLTRGPAVTPKVGLDQPANGLSSSDPRPDRGSTSTRITSGDDQSSSQHPVCTPNRKI